jgi:hypothetical protein
VLYSKDELACPGDLVIRVNTNQARNSRKSSYLKPLLYYVHFSVHITINVSTFVLLQFLWRPAYVRAESVYLQMVAYNAQLYGQ